MIGKRREGVWVIGGNNYFSFIKEFQESLEDAFYVLLKIEIQPPVKKLSNIL